MGVLIPVTWVPPICVTGISHVRGEPFSVYLTQVNKVPHTDGGQREGITMAYIECAAYINNRPARTKKALKEAVKAAPQTVMFESVGGHNADFCGGIEDIPEGTTLTVVGPDPFTKRSWYASVKNGRVS